MALGRIAGRNSNIFALCWDWITIILWSKGGNWHRRLTEICRATEAKAGHEYHVFERMNQSNIQRKHQYHGLIIMRAVATTNCFMDGGTQQIWRIQLMTKKSYQ
mmetsp:Transcript_9108/g.22214  ORF Transcript_9108/g.22214 Transcript_9108/m.22214 type:complete len:104 (+) Transcript_9108:1920-2231(+)